MATIQPTREIFLNASRVAMNISTKHYLDYQGVNNTASRRPTVQLINGRNQHVSIAVAGLFIGGFFLALFFCMVIQLKQAIRDYIHSSKDEQLNENKTLDKIRRRTYATARPIVREKRKHSSVQQMSRLYDTVEPSVIDEQMLLQCVEEQGPKGEAGKIAKKEGIDFADVLYLRLDFKNVLKIDNLSQFKNLVKLQLDNNIIEKIEGLSMLVHLEWLDLSFNNIEYVEGLDKLTKLRDLTLYNNRISELENMDSLTELHVFSAGNNRLDQLESISYLRRFKHLNSLNLDGNPFCQDANYKPYVISHLPSIVYLDYRLVDEQSREAAIKQYSLAIEELTHDEIVAQKRKEELEKKEQERQLHKEAYIEDLDGPYLFDAMFSEDTEASKLLQLPGIDELITFSNVCQELASFGLQEHDKRQVEINSFFSCIKDAIANNKNSCVIYIDKFESYKRKEFIELNNIADTAMIEKKMNDVNGEISKLWTALMGYEMQLVDQLEDSIKDFERNFADMVTSFVEQVQGMTQCRELENAHHEKLSDIAVITLEKFMKNELEEELPDELRNIFVDKDTLMNSVTTSHDCHLLKIDNKEDEIVTKANSAMQTLIEKIHSDEVQRNRSRISEINNLIDHYKDELDNLEPGAV
eukprot:gene9065-10033_t